MVTNMRVLLDQALGSGDDAGAVNFLELKVILDAILVKLGIGAEVPALGPDGELRPATDKYSERISNLERIVEEMSRPKSPSTLLNDTQNGNEAITNDFAENRLRKRVDANEEGIEKALEMLEKLAKQLRSVENDMKDTKEKLASEQEAQDDHLSKLDSLVKELESKLEENKKASEKANDLSKQLESLSERTSKAEELVKSAVNWSQLDESFSHDFFGDPLEGDKSKCKEQRSDFPRYFEGVRKLAEMSESIDDINNGLAELDKHVQSNIKDLNTRQASRVSLRSRQSSRDNLSKSSQSLTGESMRTQPNPNLEQPTSSSSQAPLTAIVPVPDTSDHGPIPSNPSDTNDESSSVTRPHQNHSNSRIPSSASTFGDSSEENSDRSGRSTRHQTRKSVAGRNSIRQSLGNFRQLINLQGRPGGQASPKSSDNRISGVSSSLVTTNNRADDLDGRMTDLLNENDKLRRDLEIFKSSTERVGDEPNKDIIMKLHNEISNVADNLLDLRKRLREEELKTDAHNEHLQEHEESLDIHQQEIDDIKTLKSDLAELQDRYDNKFQELSNHRNEINEINGNPNEISSETVEKLQKQLCGTEKELRAMEELLNSLSADGKAKSLEMARLQRLLQELSESAALKDFVTNSLDKKADASDLRAFLSKDDLDETAQSIIHQLQDLINRQAAHEQSMDNTLKEVGDAVDHRTKDDDFNKFSEQIEKRLRALRKKIEQSGEGGLRDLATEAGAAGFRRQLFNCISCDKDLAWRIANPVLPNPSAFPARVSLRPHTAYDTKHVREQARGEPSDLLDLMKRENTSDYSALLVEKELERRRKMKENKIRQEISGYNFKSGSLPRQVGGNHEIVYDRGARQQELQSAMKMTYETADLEGSDGHLYKGRVRKLPNLVRRTLDGEDLNRRPTSQANEDVPTQPTDLEID